MRRTRIAANLPAVLASAVMMSLGASAQQLHGVPGSPSSTTTINGSQLPPPPSKFGGVITQDATSSKPWWPPTVDDGYALPFNFNGTIDEVAYRIGPEQLTAADVRTREEALVAKSTGD